ncbi:urokinase plasminogen activator surface receptor-like [Triplophysa dalaica]|uniref:urokinase plasminogen activator surface receptor-like n=1 Tax=Triplophysa dalaica TaxID=1582913 RepID=UPI0024DF62FF|nr:urokinase plasminogen activator surface receptor-like [Triplophysa dalaica]
MALQCSIVLLICVFFTKALALDCYGCYLDSETGICTTYTKACESECSSMTTTAYAGEIKHSQIQKSCGGPSACLTGSINYGPSRVTINSQCCKTHLCNSQDAPDLPRKPSNGKTCFTCDDSTCSKILHCEGDENHCFTVTAEANGKQITLGGCSSNLFCGNYPSRLNDSRIFGRSISYNMKCCEGNLCNSAQSMSGFFFPLISLIFLLFI